MVYRRFFLLSWALLLVLFAPQGRAAEPDDPEPEPEEDRGKLALVLDPGGQTGAISKLQFTPDSKQLLTSSASHDLRLWDLETGKTLRVLYPPGRGLGSFFDLSPNGRTLAIASSCGTDKDSTHVVALVAFADSQVERVLKTTGPVHCLGFSPDGRHLAACVGDNLVCLWEPAATSAEPVLKIQTSFRPTGLVFSPNGRRLLCHHVKPPHAAIFNLNTGKEVVSLKGPLSDAHKLISAAWSPNGKMLATTTNQGVQLWDPTGKQLGQIGSKFNITSVAFSPDSHQLLITKGNVRPLAALFDIPGGLKEIRTFNPKDALSHMHGVFSPDGKLVATEGSWGGNNMTFVWNAATGELVQRLGATSWLPYYFAGEYTSGAGWSDDGQTVCWRKSSKGGARTELGSFHLTNLQLGPPPPASKICGSVLEEGPLSLQKPDGKVVPVLENGKPHARLEAGRQLRDARTLVGKDRAALTVGTSQVAVFDVHSGKLLRKLGHHGLVEFLAPSPQGGRYLLSLCADQKLRIWDPEKDQPLLTLFVSGRDWIAWTPEGYYAASAGGERLMGWVVDNGPDQLSTYHPASRFRARLYRPDVIALLLKEGSLEKALKKADAARGQATKQADISQVLPPQVKVTTSSKPGTTLKGGKLKIDAEASPVGADPITALQLLVDDRPYTGDKGLVTFDKPQKGPVKATWQVELPKGQHNIRVLARTGASMGTSRGMELVADNDKPEPKKEPTMYVLAVGINAYADKGLTLGGAVNDAKELEKVFQKYSSPLFPKIQTKILVDKDATRKGILEGLAWLKQNMTASDLAIFFYAGHGDVNKGEFYLLPQDVNPRELAATGFSRAELKKRMQGLPGKVLVVLDACHSGAIGLLFDDVSRELVDEDCGVIVMCAATPKQVALEKDGHGHLTRSMIEGLSGKANKRDGSVFLSHLRAYVEDRVIELSKDKQHPVVVVPPWMRPFGLSKP